ncbi:MAG: heavy metal-binding protein [Bacteroidales bacterium]|nr:heavy metal-binding protein [Bacteroidales bacterium]
MKTVRFQLETLTCPTCVAKIEGALNKQSGVENATVMFNSSRVKITFNSEEVSEKELQKVVENVGYPVLSS